jgi:alkanesulfonate monooxygenase SsuD/methylene tetrahydromethanopterin reductase-like flavin-dependent oxidoreductase (luciferase family)
MVMSTARFNLVDPNQDPELLAGRYQAMLEMASYCDDKGFLGFSVEEHHGADNGWSPTPLLNAGMITARTTNLSVTIMALLLPLHDPIRVAEDLSVLDLASGGRVMTVLGLGYRPSEYAAHRKDWAGRGKLMDECVETLLNAWSGEPFQYHGETVQVTPPSLTRPHPMVGIGGTSKISARRAARFGLPFFPSNHLPELEAYYYEKCAEAGTEGLCVMPPPNVHQILIAEDPDRAWAELGHHFLHEAATYAGWQTPDVHSIMHSHAATAEALREEGIYQILSPAECVAMAADAEGEAMFSHHPLCGGMPIERGWESLQLYVEKVLPSLS